LSVTGISGDARTGRLTHVKSLPRRRAIFASSPFLGELKHALHDGTRGRVTATRDVDLTSVGLAEIASDDGVRRRNGPAARAQARRAAGRDAHLLGALADRLAYKLKKPVRLPFVDHSTPERRRHFSRTDPDQGTLSLAS